MKVHDVLIPRFDNVFEVGFTRQMENELDLIEAGKEKWQDVVRRFYEPFREDLTKAEKELEEKCPKCGKTLSLKRGKYGAFLACSGYPECDYVKREEKEEKIMDEKCPQCGKPLIERTGKYGKFIGCSGYPECKYIRKEVTSPNPQVPGPESPEAAPGTCPDCGKPLVEKTGRFGKFFGCSGYPECKYIRRPEPKLEPDAKCPQCGKPLTIKEGKFGKFVGCSGFPQCKFIQSDRPKTASKTLDEKCPECGRALVEREGRYGKFVSCSGYPECKYRPAKKAKND
jgi:DNA topoisomerase-1